VLVYGEDRSFGTLFAQLWDREAYERYDGAPVKAAGYHPVERVSHEDTEYGPYPLDLDNLDRVLQDWGADPAVREKVGRTLARSQGRM
jgi:hypothetical protein